LPRGQKTIIQLEKYEINLPLADDFFEPPQEDIADFEFENGESAENIPFEYIEDHIFLKVKLNGTNGIWVLDSGAGSSVIDKGYAKKMGLEIQGNVKGQGVSNTVDVSFTTLPPFSLKGINFKEQQIITMDFKWLFDKTTDLEVVGILGYDFLSRLTTKIDYANQLISFYHPEKFSYSGEGVVIDTPLDNNLPTVPLTIDGKYSGMWRLDLGATGVSFHYPFAQENNLLDTPGIERISFGAGGEHISTLAKFQTAEMAGFTVKEPTLRIPQEKGEGAFSTKKYVGNIGNTFLRHFVVYLDYKNQQIILEKGDNYERIFPVDKSGLQLIYTDDKKIEVLNAAEGTPAREAGFKRGDIVQAINGIDVKYFAGIVKIRELLMENEGTEYEFKIIRNGNSKNVELELSEIF
jgi:hypothetical protein